MKKYRGTEKGPRGVYLNLANGEFVQLHEKARLLPGTKEVNYIRVPPVLAMIAGPFIGLAFIIFLPLVGIAGFVSFVGYRLWRAIVTVERRTVQLGAAGWNPERAYFIRHGTNPDENPEAKSEEELEKLEEEITIRRQSGEQ